MFCRQNCRQFAGINVSPRTCSVATRFRCGGTHNRLTVIGIDSKAKAVSERILNCFEDRLAFCKIVLGTFRPGLGVVGQFMLHSYQFVTSDWEIQKHQINCNIEKAYTIKWRSQARRA